MHAGGICRCYQEMITIEQPTEDTAELTLARGQNAKPSLITSTIRGKAHSPFGPFSSIRTASEFCAPTFEVKGRRKPGRTHI